MVTPARSCKDMRWIILGDLKESEVLYMEGSEERALW